jgi:hypothetical protein
LPEATWERIATSPAVIDLLGDLIEDAATPAGVREALALDPPGDDTPLGGLRPLCLDDTGVWPRVVLALAREAGIDPLAIDDNLALGGRSGLSAEQLLWCGLLFGADREELAAAAPDAGISPGAAAVDPPGPVGTHERLSEIIAEVTRQSDPELAELRAALARAEQALLKREREVQALLGDAVCRWHREAIERARRLVERSRSTAIAERLRLLAANREETLANVVAEVRDEVARAYDQRISELEARIAEGDSADDERGENPSLLAGVGWADGDEFVVFPLLPTDPPDLRGHLMEALSEVARGHGVEGRVRVRGGEPADPVAVDLPSLSEEDVTSLCHGLARELEQRLRAVDSSTTALSVEIEALPNDQVGVVGRAIAALHEQA